MLQHAVSGKVIAGFTDEKRKIKNNNYYDDMKIVKCERANSHVFSCGGL